MNDAQPGRPVAPLQYEPDTRSRPVTFTDDAVVINVQRPIQPFWRVAAFLWCSSYLAYTAYLIARPPLLRPLVHPAVEMLFPILMSAAVVTVVEWRERFGYSRLRVHRQGFEHEHRSMFKAHWLSVRWEEVGEIARVRRAISPSDQHEMLEIQLLNRGPDEVVPLQVMSGFDSVAIDRAVALLDEYRQRAADGPPPSA